MAGAQIQNGSADMYQQGAPNQASHSDFFFFVCVGVNSTVCSVQSWCFSPTRGEIHVRVQFVPLREEEKGLVAQQRRLGLGTVIWEISQIYCVSGKPAADTEK